MKKKRSFKDIFRNIKNWFKTCIRKVYNYFLCKRYSFLKCYNVFTEKFIGYSTTWYDDIPAGWRKAFGKELLKELKKTLKKNQELNTFRFTQIKEKYGHLCLYHAAATYETSKVLEKYETLSEKYCIHCGRKAEYMTEGWITFVCEKCFDEKIEAKKDFFGFTSPEALQKYKESRKINNEN